ARLASWIGFMVFSLSSAGVLVAVVLEAVLEVGSWSPGFSRLGPDSQGLPAQPPQAGTPTPLLEQVLSSTVSRSPSGPRWERHCQSRHASGGPARCRRAGPRTGRRGGRCADERYLPPRSRREGWRTPSIGHRAKSTGGCSCACRRARPAVSAR